MKNDHQTVRPRYLIETVHLVPLILIQIAHLQVIPPAVHQVAALVLIKIGQEQTRQTSHENQAQIPVHQMNPARDI